MTENYVVAFSYTDVAAFLAGSLPEQLSNRSVMQRSTINFNRFFAVKPAGWRVFNPMFIGLIGSVANFPTSFVIGRFFLCLLAVSHTLCKYLTSVLTFFHSVDKLMFHWSKGSRFF
ncbi:hypothetical protein [Mixta theicola]|uniref:hypothetical protein n=1 Tax=Mixta theicola TaxID=1458355 RepID=UPI001056FBDB|nr:hypothetical protein [Mixta theicola]